MFSKSPLNRTKKRPQKTLRLVDVVDDEVEEVSLMTPPMKLNKRPREDSHIEMPRKSSFGTICDKDDNEGEETKVFMFCVLMPNGTSVELKISELRKEIPIEEFIDAVRKEYNIQNNHRRSLSQKRRIIWDYQELYFTDVDTNKIRLTVDFREFSSSERHLLWLHDGSPEPEEYEGMWDLTPDTDLLKELPADYTCETALADLIDNSLQALWSNGTGQKRLISVEILPEKITIFDSGPGMDGAKGNLVKWGRMGASLHRSVKEKAIGGEPPYLMPFFGMFGYGGPVATMCLGRRAVVSSKTRESNKVYTLHMEREALLSASHTANCWKTKGGVRDPHKDENLKAPHGSFTKVEIFDPKHKVKNLNIKQLRFKLKDIYFPYIQCDEMSGKTSTPIEFQVNGVNLAGVLRGEVATTNLLSCNGPDFTVQLHLSIRPESSSIAGQNEGVSTTANARLRCVYFPISEGTENIQKILDKLNEYGCGMRESFESFSRVSVRRLGRLLPETRWGLLPFMEPRQKKGEKAQIQKKLCSRVKCFIDMDSGFNPTPQKTDLAHQHPYTKALKNFGNRSPENEKEVRVEITRDGKKLTLAQLEKLYHDWITDMHDRYDEETDVGLDKPTIIVVSSKIKKLDLTSDVLRVHKKVQRKGRCWAAGENIKVLKGACAGCHNGHVYATLEYIILEGLQGDASGEARLICRPLGLPENKGCRLSVGEGNIYLNDSFVFPIRIIDSDKCLPVDDNEWGKKLEAFNQKLPAAINLLSLTDCRELEINGGLPSSLEAGDRPPENIVAVVRPKLFNSGKSSKILDQRFIIFRDNLEMSLEIRRRASDGDTGEFDHLYSARLSASSHKEPRGLYIFPLSDKWPMLLQEPGILMFTFSLAEPQDIQLEHKVQVRGSAGVGRWELIHHDKNQLYTVRVGSCFKPLSIVCYDEYKKHIRFTGVPKLAIKLISSGKTLAQVRNKKVEITSDKLTMRIKEFCFITSMLDDIRPSYEAALHITTQDEAFSVALPCKVIPTTPKKITVHPPELQKQLLPGQIIEELVLEVFDEYGNHVKEDENILLRLDGFSVQDGSGIIRGVGIDCMKKVDANGRVDLSNILKVSRGYGKRVVLSVLSKDELIFELRCVTEVRVLRAVRKVFMNCEAGSELENIAFEVIDSEGMVDESIHDEEKHGPSHTLAIECDRFCIDESEQYRFLHGRCNIPSLPLPPTEGIFYFRAKHSRYPELSFPIKVCVEKTRQENNDNVVNHEDVRNPIHPIKSLSPIPKNPDVLQSRMAAQVSDKVSNSALISQKVCVEKTRKENCDSVVNHEDVRNPIHPIKSLSPIPRNPDVLRSRVAAQVSDKVSNSALISQKVCVEKTRKENCDSVVNHEDVRNPIHPIKSLSPIPRNPDVLQSRVAAQVSDKVSNSALISRKVCVEKTRKENCDSVVNHEDVRNPIHPIKSLSPIPRNPDVLQSRVAAQVSDKVSNSALISRKVCVEKTRQENCDKVHIEKQQQKDLDSTMNRKDVGNLILSSQRSSACEQILPVSHSLRVSQVMGETFSPHSSKGFISRINDSPVLKTPKLEHGDSQGGNSDILCSKKKSLIKKLEDDIANSALQRSRHEKNIESLNCSLLHIQQDILQLQAVVGPDLGNPSSSCGQHSTLEQIKNRSQSAASVICKIPEQEQKSLGIVGVVALLGTVASSQLSRMLAQYLGKNQMLAIVCRNYAASHSLQKFATDHGLPINGSYSAFCLEDIRPPKFREPNIDPHELLPLQHPTLPNGNEPQGFLGYAVNLICVEPSHLQWRTESGHSLRETLFYRLFGKLQVYKDRDCMIAAQSCIEAGAVSLDGGMMRGNGHISLGHWEPKILFPVMCPELEAKKLEQARIKQRIKDENDAIQQLLEKIQTCIEKYNLLV